MTVVVVKLAFSVAVRRTFARMRFLTNRRVECGEEKIQTTVRYLTSSNKFTVWYGFSTVGIVGPVFLEENVNSEICGALLEETYMHFCKE